MSFSLLSSSSPTVETALFRSPPLPLVNILARREVVLPAKNRLVATCCLATCNIGETGMTPRLLSQISAALPNPLHSQRKQSERAHKIESLPQPYLSPLSASERSILGKPIQDLVKDVNNRVTSPIDVLRAYGKVAVKAHAKTNCLTEILFPEAEEWAQKEVNLDGPLAGIPVSLKDTVCVKGFDTTVGLSCNTGRPCVEDGPLVRLIKDAGGIPFAKTNLPITMLSFESTNDVWGRCTNPHNPNYSPGGSTGGEAALLAFGGSRIGFGSDVAGSVRVPAHFSGCYALRCSAGRWPKTGVVTCLPGQEGVPSVYSPMARTLNDLVYFSRSIIQMKPWKYDHTVYPMAWKSDVEKEFREKSKLKVGVMRDDTVVTPSPACARALQQVVSALEAEGHEVYDITPPSPYDALVIASQLLTSDGCETFLSYFRTGEWNDAGAAQMAFYMSLPRPIKYLHYLYVRYIKRDPIWAGLLRNWHPKTAAEHWALIARRELYRTRFHSWWDEDKPGSGRGMDVLLTVPNATPAVPHDGMRDAVSSCGYTFLFNLLDYAAGVMPVTHVDAKLDALPKDFKVSKLNGVARGAYKHYDAVKMEGLPVGVQIVGRRLEEEKVLAVMERIGEVLDRRGEAYRLLEVD